MFKLGIIEESMDNKNVLCDLASCFVAQRIENVPEDAGMAYKRVSNSRG